MRRLIARALAVVFGCVLVGLTPAVRAAEKSPEGWTPVAQIPGDVAAGEAYYRAEKSFAVHLDRAAMAAVLKGAPAEQTAAAANPLRMRFPMPDGRFEAFDVVESSNMHPELQARFPEIRSYAGVSAEDPTRDIRFDLSPQGFSAQVLGPDGASYIYKYSKNNLDYYSSFERRDFRGLRTFQCLTPNDPPPFANREFTPGRSGTTRITYRLAVGVTGEYTQAVGGTVTLALAAVNSVVNEINAVYLREFSVRFQLAARNDLIIFTNPATDPYTNPLSPPNTANENTNAINTRIGSASYDVGHVVYPEENGGVSMGLGLVCSEANKARAYSSSNPPTGFQMSIRLMAHELGHQHASPHSWNNCPGVLQQRAANNAYEPGSGSTIMSYSGLCDTENVVTSPDPMFNSGSFDFVYSFVSLAGGAFCGTREDIGNVPPQADAGADWTIPKGTPFTLTGSGRDDNAGDVLTYSWEQRSLGDIVSILTPDDGRSPIIRARMHNPSPSRTIPRFATLISGTPDPGEIIPTRARTIVFRLTVRDNSPLNGGIATDDMNLTIAGRAGPFAVTAPAANASWIGVQTVTWSVAGTDNTPVSTARVRILLSTDNGTTFPIVLASDTPNDGSEEIVLPNTNTTNARIKIEPIGNIYFALSPRFNIRPPTAGVQIVTTNTIQVDDRFGNGNNNQRAEPGETTVGIRFGLRNARATTPATVVGTLTTTTPGVTIKRGVINYPAMPYGVNVLNDSPFVISVAPSVACGSTMAFRLTVRTTNPVVNPIPTFTFNLIAGLPARPGDPVTFTYDNTPVAIPDFPAPSVKLRINVNGIGTIGKVVFAFNGDECSTVTGATTVGLDHPAVGDLLMTVISPDGTPVLMLNQPGFMNTPTEGNNFCQTILDDAALTSIQEIRDEENPYSGRYRPLNPFLGLVGRPADGTWIIDAADQRFGFTGNIRTCSLIVSPQLPASCVPPSRPQCPADMDDGTGDGVPDGGVTIDDLIYFLGQYEQGSAIADLDDGTGTGTSDGGVTIDDLLYFVSRFAQGC